MAHFLNRVSSTGLVAFAVAILLASFSAAQVAHAAPAYEDNPHPQIVLSAETLTPVTVRVVSDTVVFDGDAFTPLLKVEDKDGNSLYSWNVEATMPSFTNATKGKVKVAAPHQVVLRDWQGTDVTDMCDITLVDGTFEVKPRGITIITPGASKTYDGKALTTPLNYRMEIDNSKYDDPQHFVRNGDTVSVPVGRYSIAPHYGAGDLASSNALSGREVLKLETAFWSFKLTGTQAKVGQSRNTYSINWGDVNLANYTIKDDLGILKVTAPALSTQPPASQTTPRPQVTQPTNTASGTAGSASAQNADTIVASAAQPSAVAPASFTPSVTPATTPSVNPSTDGTQTTSNNSNTENDTEAKEGEETSQNPDSGTQTIGGTDPVNPDTPEVVIEDDETPLASFTPTEQNTSIILPALFAVSVLMVLALVALFTLLRKRNSSF